VKPLVELLRRSEAAAEPARVAEEEAIFPHHSPSNSILQISKISKLENEDPKKEKENEENG
jgi:hypothetical protein